MNSRLPLLHALAVALGLTAAASMSAADQNPAPVFQCAPHYSLMLRHDEVEGKVTVSFTVNAQGGVEDVAIVSSTEKAFERVTVAAVRQWKFTPATRNGVAVSVAVRQTVNFVLSDLHPESLIALNR